MNYRWVTAIVGVFAVAAAAQDLQELDWSVESSTMYVFRDPNQSLLIVESTVAGLSFDSNRGIISREDIQPGVWHVRLEPGVQIITIKADGYLPLELPRHSYAPKNVRKLRVTAKTPVPATVTGEPKLSIVEINTDPSGASVEIGGVQLQGTTPISDLFNSGQYTVRVVRDGYKNVEETIVIDASVERNVFSYKLVSESRRVGNIAVSVHPPDARIELYSDGGESYSAEGTQIFSDIPVGEYRLEVFAPAHASAARTIQLASGETVRERIIIARGPSGPVDDMFFSEIEGGEFMMGAQPFEQQASDSEYPRHSVSISSFELMTTEVTQAMWDQLMNTNPSFNKGDSLPVHGVTWLEAQAFIGKLNELDPRGNYRLPTEAEWEYACRAGRDSSRFWWGDDPEYVELGKYAWYNDNSDGKPHPIGRKGPNPWGLHDIQGNVWEWCSDWYGETYYASSPQDDPQGPSSGESRVLRGGSWNYGPEVCRSAYRGHDDPSIGFDYYGFRVARNPESNK